MTAAGFHGKSGKVMVGAATKAEVRSWSFEPKCGVAKYASTDTGGFKAGVAGIRDSSGKIECALPAGGAIQFADGDAVTLLLHVDNTGNNYFSVPAIISGSPVELKIEEDQVVSVTFNFEGAGAWTGYGICSTSGGSSS